jgi:aspartyl-tRNA(Asn)/glutamyl-tRNA(Gln) amidotransferase subunit A
MITNADAITARYDGLLMPTTPIQAPLMSDFKDDAEYGRLNLLALRNPSIANFLDRCAISIPIASNNGLPVGLSLMGNSMDDRNLLGLAASVEKIVAPRD